MPSVIGHGRYARWIYPQSPRAAGGGGAAITPLSRQKFIDGDTTQLGLNGSVAEPFKTIAQFMASRTNASVPDATANYVGWVMPALSGYVENISFPPYVSTELRADSVSLTAGTFLTGNVTWTNTGPQPNAATVAIVAMHNVSVTGNFTVTDDAGAPTSIVLFSGDEIGGGTVEILGIFESSTTTKLQTVIFTNVELASGIDAGFSATSALVELVDSVCVGDSISAKTLLATDARFGVSQITVNDVASFVNCLFSSATQLSAPANGSFDGLSWQSFSGSGSTRAVGTAVLVQGGYSGAGVEGADLIGASTSVSLNGAALGTTAGYTGEHSGNHYSTSNGVPTTVTLKTGGGESPGDTLLITKEDLGANVLSVKNNATTTIGTIPTLSRGFVLARYDGTDWVFEEGGSLAA